MTGTGTLFPRATPFFYLRSCLCQYCKPSHHPDGDDTRSMRRRGGCSRSGISRRLTTSKAPNDG